MDKHFKVFPSKHNLNTVLGSEILSFSQTSSKTKRNIFLAFSGGKTPRLLFQKLASMINLHDKTRHWSHVHFFWVDERCVPFDHEESNFGMANKYLLSYLDIDSEHLHRIMGEKDPEAEAKRYSDEIRNIVPLANGLPVFDWIFLGLGEDGHTASVFPDRIDLVDSDKLCIHTLHPQTGQSRITMTHRTINHADRITFVVTGASKSTVIKHIYENHSEAAMYPANYIFPERGTLEWYVDEEAAKHIAK